MALDKLRQQSRSFIIWFLFAIIILSFVVTFGPASMRLSCGKPTRAGTLLGSEISNADMTFALRLAMPSQAPATFRANVYDQLVQREILAKEGQRLGFHVPEDEITNMITKRRRFIALGMDFDLAQQGAWPMVRDRDGKLVPAPHYYHDQFKRWVQYRLGMKTSAFVEQQRKELLARRVETMIKNGVIVTDQEARAVFEYRNHSLELEFAKFRIDDFKKGILIARKDVMSWLSIKENLAKVDALYKKTKWKLTGLAHERRVRHILVKVDEKSTDEEKKVARDKLTKLRPSLVKTPTDFAKMASLLSQDEASKVNGGDLGWREKSKLGYDDKFADAVFKLQKMSVSEILVSKLGYHLVLVEAERKGDVKLGDARPWLAEQILQQDAAKSRAGQVAKEALRRLLAGQSMAEVFPPVKVDAPDDDKPETGTEPKPKKPEPPKRWHELLPAVEQVEVKRTETTIGKIGKLDGLVHKVWALTEADPVLGEVLTIPGVGTNLGSLVVVRLKTKTLPDSKEFAQSKDQLITELLEVKRDDAVKRWVFARCEALRSEGKVKLEKHITDIVFYAGKGDQRKKQIFKYVPCQRLERFGRAANLGYQ